MKKILVAGVAAVAILGSSAVYAQHRYHHHHQRMSPEDRAAFFDSKIAAVKAGLKLTPDQEKLWPPVETAVRDFAKQRMEQANARAAARGARRAERDQKQAEDKSSGDKVAADQTRDPVTRLRECADRMAVTATGLKKIADAADPLYKTLDDAQKRRLSMLTRMGGHHGWRGHDFGRDRDGDRFDRDRRFERGGNSERL